MKDMLVLWKKETEGQDMSTEEQVSKMKELVMGNQKLLENPFFQSVKAL